MKKFSINTFQDSMIKVLGPITEEALLLGLSIAMIIIIIGLVFGIFQWLANSIFGLFGQLGLG
ncbi:MAG: hypothetical protein ACTSRG_22445 [Candidatus Helarchaeota archaeon]